VTLVLIAAIFFGDVEVQHPPTEPVSYVVPSHWAALADCESGEWLTSGHVEGSARWDLRSHPHRGGLQWLPSTWLAVRPAGAPDDPADASPAQQVAAGEALLAEPWGGWHHWPVCARRTGLLP
jgi:hypothetical protein